METILLLLLLIPYTLIRYLVTDHETKTEKDVRQYQAGIQLVKEKKYAEAIRYFDQVLQEKPHCALAVAYRGKCNLQLKNLYSCVFDCSLATSLDDTLSEAYLDKGKALYELEEFQPAFLEFDKAVWHARKNPEAFRWRALGRVRLRHTYYQVEADLLKAIDLGDEEAAHYLRLVKASRSDQSLNRHFG